jgi:hypothetical protein
VLLPGLASTITILTATLLGWAGVRSAELCTMVASIAVLSWLAAQGEAARVPLLRHTAPPPLTTRDESLAPVACLQVAEERCL